MNGLQVCVQAGSIPWRRLASAAGEARKANSGARPAPARSPAHPGGKRGDDLHGRRHRPDDGDALQVDQLAELLESQRHLAAGDQRADRNARWRLHEPALQLLRDAPALEQPCSATPLGPVE